MELSFFVNMPLSDLVTFYDELKDGKLYDVTFHTPTTAWMYGWDLREYIKELIEQWLGTLHMELNKLEDGACDEAVSIRALIKEIEEVLHAPRGRD